MKRSFQYASYVLVFVVWCHPCYDTTPWSDVQRFTPNAQDRAWWAALERCSGLRRDIDDVLFYTDKKMAWNSFMSKGGLLAGQTITRPYDGRMRIVVVVDMVYRHDRFIMQHEMMHALLSPLGGHPHKYFRNVCGDVQHGAQE